MKTRLVLVFESLAGETEREKFLDELLQAVDVILNDELDRSRKPLQSAPLPHEPPPRFFWN